MKTVDIFSTFAGQATMDANVNKYGSFILKNGFRGVGKLNPTMVWIDTGIAVIEACDSYFQYSAACRVTERMQEQNRALERILNLQLEKHKLDLDNLRKERFVNNDSYRRRLIAVLENEQLNVDNIRDQMDLLREMHALLLDQRQKSDTFRQLTELQVALDGCIDATLTLVLETMTL